MVLILIFSLPQLSRLTAILYDVAAHPEALFYIFLTCPVEFYNVFLKGEFCS